MKKSQASKMIPPPVPSDVKKMGIKLIKMGLELIESEEPYYPFGTPKAPPMPPVVDEEEEDEEGEIPRPPKRGKRYA